MALPAYNSPETWVVTTSLLPLIPTATQPRLRPKHWSYISPPLHPGHRCLTPLAPCRPSRQCLQQSLDLTPLKSFFLFADKKDYPGMQVYRITALLQSAKSSLLLNIKVQTLIKVFYKLTPHATSTFIFIYYRPPSSSLLLRLHSFISLIFCNWSLPDEGKTVPPRASRWLERVNDSPGNVSFICKPPHLECTLPFIKPSHIKLLSSFPDHPRTEHETTRGSPYVLEPSGIIQTSQYEARSPCLTHSFTGKPQASCAYAFPLFLQPLDWPWCFSLWPCVAMLYFLLLGIWV